MIIQRIHHEIKTRLNKLNSNHKKDFPSAYIDDAINKATDDFIEIFYVGNTLNQYKFGFEVTQQRTDMLRTLVIEPVSLPLTLISTGRYSVNIPNTYKHFSKANVIQDSCIIPLTIVRHNDIDVKLEDENTKPSKKWKRCLATFNENKILIYSDGAITSLQIVFIKKPTKVFFGGYNSLEFTFTGVGYQTADPAVTSDLPEQYHDLLIDMTVQYLSSVLEDQNKYVLQEKNIINKT